MVRCSAMASIESGAELAKVYRTVYAYAMAQEVSSSVMVSLIGELRQVPGAGVRGSCAGHVGMALSDVRDPSDVASSCLGQVECGAAPSAGRREPSRGHRAPRPRRSDRWTGSGLGYLVARRDHGPRLWHGRLSGVRKRPASPPRSRRALRRGGRASATGTRCATGARGGDCFTDEPDHIGVETFDDPVLQIAWSHHWMVVEGELIRHSAPYRYVWPAELDLMAQLAGFQLHERWAGWHSNPFAADSRAQVAVYKRQE